MKNILLLIPLLVLVGCNPKKSSVRANIQSATGANIAGNYDLSNQCPQNTSGLGSIWEAGNNNTASSLYTTSGTFEDRAKALLSATVIASDIGQISGLEQGPTGVRFQGVIKLEASGQVVAAHSKMRISIFDHLVGKLDANGAKSEPIVIDFASPKSQITGLINKQTGEGYVSFKDSYGEVRFEGRLDAQFFTGLVTFQNIRNVNDGAPASGTLGQFKVARCGIIQ